MTGGEDRVVDMLVRFLDFLWSSFLLLAPMLLLGLFPGQDH